MCLIKALGPDTNFLKKWFSLYIYTHKLLRSLHCGIYFHSYSPCFVLSACPCFCVRPVVDSPSSPCSGLTVQWLTGFQTRTVSGFLYCLLGLGPRIQLCPDWPANMLLIQPSRSKGCCVCVCMRAYASFLTFPHQKFHEVDGISSENNSLFYLFYNKGHRLKNY